MELPKPGEKAAQPVTKRGADIALEKPGDRWRRAAAMERAQLLADGGIGARTALVVPYVIEPGRG